MVVQGVPVGVPVEHISTDSMVGAGSTTRRIYERMNQRLVSRSGRVSNLMVNFVWGVILPTYAMIIYYKHRDAPCEKPIAGWLKTYGFVGYIIGILGLWKGLKELALASVLERAARVRDDAAQAEALRVASPLACVTCCCIVPLWMFSAIWWLKGNFDVWGTFPRDDISYDEPIGTFAGCDAGLLNGARTIYLITYACAGVFIVGSCIFCGIVAGEVARHVDAQRPLV